jgi:hypothetical protein
MAVVHKALRRELSLLPGVVSAVLVTGGGLRGSKGTPIFSPDLIARFVG